MTTVDITYGTGQVKNDKLELPIIDLMALEVNKLMVIKGFIEGLGTDEWLKDING